MRGRARKSKEIIRDGKVQRKSRTSHFPRAEPGRPVIERHRPGPSFRQVLLKRDVERFIELLPDWSELSRGLQAVLLTQGDPQFTGWYAPGVVAVCAWDRDISGLWTRRFAEENREILEQLEVEVEPRDSRTVFIDWEERSVKAFQLLNVLLREVGDHHDKLTKRSRHEPSRGEPFAAWYAKEYAETIWGAYQDAFGW